MRTESLEMTGTIDPETQSIIDGGISCPACCKAWVIVQGGGGLGGCSFVTTD